MPVQATVTNRDLKLLHDLCDRRRARESGAALPESVLRELADLVPCDQVGIVSLEPYRQREVAREWFVPSQDFLDTEAPELASVGDEEVLQFFWQHFWSWVCSYPERTGDCVSVIRASDLPGSRDAAGSLAEFFRSCGTRHEILVPLPPSGPVANRVLLRREDGRDFSDRERLLLMLARPRLAELHEAATGQRSGAAGLSPRQRELMRLVAAGLTNQQISRRMLITKSTVRKHLENIYRVLDVTNRVEAVAACSPDRPVDLVGG